MQASLIVAAGGRSRRFRRVGDSGGEKTNGSKLLAPLGGSPVVVRSLRAFDGIPEIRERVLVCPVRERVFWKKFLRDHGFRNVRLAAGGPTRAASVLNGLKQTRREWILVHDAARPLVTKRAILSLLENGRRAGGAILAAPVVPTIKRVDPLTMKISETIDRAFLFEAQTPQMMRRKTLLACYRKLGEKALNATDEASLLESCGHSVAIVPNEDRNLKITTPADLAFAESCAGSYTIPFKIGLGRDTHRLVSGRKFYLGGRVIPFEKGSLGHSDGDALLHALTDAVLGVLGEGDIGDWFSDKDPRFKNIRSTVLIQRVLVHAREKGWTPAYADCIVTLERPKLGPHKKQIGASVARLLGIPPSEVSIKAKTAEGLGAEGAGLAVTCEALVAMRRAS